jgi:UDP-2-acetamido-3-amino-2,3-dideoxy-glucuronate N-acetyltransferase
MRDVYIHPRALCETERIGPGTRVWAFTHLLPGASIGADCNICDGVFMEGGATVGDRVTVKCGVQLWSGVHLRDDVFVGPNATFTNDRFPRSRQWPDEYLQTVVHEGASIGANATILPGCEIGVGAMVGAGAVVTRSVPAHAIVTGNPARISGYTSRRSGSEDASGPASAPQEADSELISAVRVKRFAEYSDLRGRLSAIEMPQPAIPFEVRRCFMVYDVPDLEVRGEHAHRECDQFMICTSGSVTVVVDNGEERGSVVLDHPTIGIYVPAMVWASQFRYSSNAVLLVFASHPYDPADYIREYDEFISVVRANPSARPARRIRP